jgi:hypothetical protein
MFQSSTWFLCLLRGTYHAFKQIYCLWVTIIVDEHIRQHLRVIANLLQDPVNANQHSQHLQLPKVDEHISIFPGWCKQTTYAIYSVICNPTMSMYIKKFYIFHNIKMSSGSSYRVHHFRDLDKVCTYFRTAERWLREVSDPSTERKRSNEKKMPNSTCTISFPQQNLSVIDYCLLMHDHRDWNMPPEIPALTKYPVKSLHGWQKITGCDQELSENYYTVDKETDSEPNPFTIPKKKPTKRKNGYVGSQANLRTTDPKLERL